MAEQTGISWVRNSDGTPGSTFNPWVGCEKVSPGCAHCYAETLVTGRMGRPGTWGAEGHRERTSEANWRKPLAWNKRAAQTGIRERVFCASLADVFEPRPELAPWRSDLFRLIEQTPHLDWLILTKRPEEARDWLHRFHVENRPLRMRDEHGTLWAHTPSEREWTSRDYIGWGVFPNVWVGTSIENARHTWRADVLREIPAAVRFISAEPLLGSLFPSSPGLDVSASAEQPMDGRLASAARTVGDDQVAGPDRPRDHAPLDLTGIDWVIVGGESGGRESRPMHPEWFRELRDAVLAVSGRRPAFHGKQWGSWTPADPREGGEWNFGDGKGRVWVTRRGQTLPNGTAFVPEGAAWMRYAGAAPTSGGKLLDGEEWCEIPEWGLTPA